MTIEIEHVPKRTETVQDIVGEPDEGDELLSTVEEEDAYGNIHTRHKVEREIVVTKEKYIVRTADAMDSKSRTYWIEQNEGDEWEVVKRRTDPARGHATVATSGDLSTKTVREALRAQHGIEVVN